MKTLHLWLLPGNGLNTIGAAREQTRGYLREHPDTRIEIAVRTPSRLWSQLFALLKRPREAPRPHLVEIPGHWTPTLARLGLLEDLSAAEGAVDLSPWIAPLHEHCLGGPAPAGDGPGAPPRPLCSLPWWLEATVLYFRPDLLEQAGADAECLGTWAGLREACGRLSRRLPASIVPIANANPRESVSLGDVAPSVWSRGGDFFSPDGSRSVFQREEAYAGIRDYLELLEKGWMPLLGKSGRIPATLFEGGAALQFCGRMPPAARDRRFAVAAMPCPRGERTQAGVLKAHHLAALKGAGEPREAHALLRHLTRPDQAAGYARALGALPCGAAELGAALAQAGEVGQTFVAALAQARPLPNVHALGTLERIFDRRMEDLIRAILRRSYDQEMLRQELIYAASEMDYILSMTPAASA